MVLLGNPGAGKSHLFRIFASRSSGRLVTARNFLNLDVATFSAVPELFIDALDEKRGGRGDKGTVDAIVSKLALVKPRQVRIACRAADWLGDSDLSAFQAYFEQTGGVVVVSLEPLSENEQLEVLAQNNHPDPSSFLDKARKFGLEWLLTNPQNLLMLSEVVQQQDWPKTRTDLFRKSVRLLLSEHNKEHARSERGVFAADELIEAAGSVCAIRLIGDIDAVSLLDGGSDDFVPSYRSISVGDHTKVLASLGRRVFGSGPVVESVDYTHRTVAEFLAAEWMARRVAEGLPLERVRALIGIDGHPASELRGLHAWLAVHLSDPAAVIEADPYGVLTYGDAASLSLNNRQLLLTALARLAESDPWFLSENWSDSFAAALGGKDFLERFREILTTHSSSPSLRRIVLDALGSGPAIGLHTELVQILVDPKSRYSERSRCVPAILKQVDDGRAILALAYFKIGTAPDDIRIRAEILREIYGSISGRTETAVLLSTALTLTHELIGGALWHIADDIPLEDIEPVLRVFSDSIPELPALEEREGRKNSMEVLHVLDSLLVRLIEKCTEIDAKRVQQWIRLRLKCGADHFNSEPKELRTALQAKPRLLGELVDIALESLQPDHHAWVAMQVVHEACLNAASDEFVLQRVLVLLDKSSGVNKVIFHEVALMYCFRLDGTTSIFERLCDRAATDPELTAAHERNCSVPIPEWRIEDRVRRRAAMEKREAVRAKNRRDFEVFKDSIRTGTNNGWMGYLGKVYFGMFSDVDQTASPSSRLAAELGNANAQVAIEGLLALVQSRRMSTVDEIVALHENQKHWPWWYAAVAGLDEHFESGATIASYSDEYLSSVLAIDCLHPTFWRQGNTTKHVEHKWKQELYRDRPDLVVRTYARLARSDLKRKATNANGLYELMHSEQLKERRSEVAFQLLDEFPGTDVHQLTYLLEVALSSNAMELVGRARSALGRFRGSNSKDRRAAWMAVGYLVAPEEFGPIILRHKALQKIIVWNLRDLSGFRRRGGSVGGFSTLTISQREFIVLLVARHFHRTGHPAGGWSGSTNAWDASEYLLTLVNQLSGDSSEEARRTLEKLVTSPLTRTYAENLKHARAQQFVRYIDSSYRQPSWSQVVGALANGVPANVADLQALAIAHISDLGPYIASTNVDTYKRFWNEDRFNKVVKPKGEESCRDGLVELLRPRLRPLGVRVEPEGHMALDKRADVVVFAPGMKLAIEL